MKTKFSIINLSKVKIEYTETQSDGTYKRLTRIFRCPPFGGYVVEVFPDGKVSQVCENLEPFGSALFCDDSENLLSLIKKNFKKYIRAKLS